MSESKFTEAPQELTSCLKEASNHLGSKGQLNPLRAKNNVNLFDQDFNKEKMFHLVTGLLVDDYISNNLLSIKENGAHFQAEFKKTLIRDQELEFFSPNNLTIPISEYKGHSKEKT